VHRDPARGGQDEATCGVGFPVTAAALPRHASAPPAHRTSRGATTRLLISPVQKKPVWSHFMWPTER
jgi:hypothetical protein